TNETYRTSLKGEIKVISNNKGYFDSLNIDNGAQLYLDDSPIGYNIHLPIDKINSVMVKVYGGDESEEREKSAYRPLKLNTLETHLLNNGIAIIQLNLPDLLKLNTSQGSMPEDLFLEIHACIHQFYDTIKNAPEKLDESLKVLKNKGLFLYGASFGGMMVLTHAEHYPGTYAGYISHDGGISRLMGVKGDRLKRSQFQSWLNPAVHSEIE